MRIGLICLAVAAVWVSAPALADAPPDAKTAVTDYYPSQALAARADGEAIIKCRSDIRGAFVGCTIVSEKPIGLGFGAAALAIAANAPVSPDAHLSPEEMALELPFRFTFKAKPLSISPNLFVTKRIGAPHWIRRPSVQDFEATFPPDAARKHVSGRAVALCRVDAHGAMTACEITSETPAGFGFGAATLKMSRYFLMSTFMDDGFPTVGAKVNIPIVWNAPP